MSLIERIKSTLKKSARAAGSSLDVGKGHRADTEMAGLSGYESRYTEMSSAASQDAAADDVDYVTLPVLGRRPAVLVRNAGIILVILSLVSFVVLAALTLNKSNKISAQVAATGEALMQSQR